MWSDPSWVMGHESAVGLELPVTFRSFCQRRELVVSFVMEPPLRIELI